MDRDIEAAKSFLDAERSSDSNQPKASGSGDGSGKKKVKKSNEKKISKTTHKSQNSSSDYLSQSPLTRCIMKMCKGCDKSFKPIVKGFLKANGRGWLEDPEARNYLRTFLEKHKDVDDSPSEAEKCLNLYELCLDQNNFENNQAELEELMFDEEWEKMLMDVFENKTVKRNEAVKEFLSKVMGECANHLWDSYDFKQMREDLKQKININD